MSKYYKLSVGIGIILLFPVMVFAGTYNDVSLTTSSTIGLNNTSLAVSGSADAVDSITVDTDHFSVTLDAGSTLTVRSGNRYKLNTDSSSLYVTEDCTSSYSGLTLSSPTGGATVTITVTPDSNVNCSFSSGTSGSGSSGSHSVGGGSSYVAPVVVKTVAVANPVVNKPVASTQGQLLTKDLSKGSKDDEVSILQTLLSSDKSIYPEGLITGLIGPATERAVKRFQAKYGISQVGKVGPATRKKIAQVFQGATTVPTTVVSTSKPTPLTSLEAIQKFQIKYGIAAPGQPGYGTYGPKTKAKFKELSK